MVSRVYSIRDRKSGLYGTPFFSVNDECATRDFKRICNSEVNEFIAEDLELFYLGEFNNETGVVEGEDNAMFLANFTRKDDI